MKPSIFTIIQHLNEIEDSIDKMDNAFRGLSDHIPDDSNIFNEYQAMIAGAIKTRKYLEKARKVLRGI